MASTDRGRASIQLLRPDNFTPPSRTPWGGTAIAGLKSGLGLAVDPLVAVGESWEISTEPSFPSLLESGDSLETVIEAEPERWLGASVASEYGGCPLLVKIIDAAEHLSLQVHPSEHALLGEDECGKTEAWIILAARPEARIYLGFRDGVDESAVADCLERGGMLNLLMNEVPVRTGDVFFIQPGLAHALGAGTTLLEVQRVRPHRRTITYRFWDWNRRYDAKGRPDPNGELRPLHVKEALAVTDWSGPRGARLVETSRRRISARSVESELTRSQLLDEAELWAEQWTGTGAATLPTVDTLLGVVCLDGRAELTSEGQRVQMVKGQSAVVPAASADVQARLSSSHVVLCCVPEPARADTRSSSPGRTAVPRSTRH